MIDSNVHILPGVDDGAQDEEQAIYMLEKAKADGITHWIVTPHFNHKSSKYSYEALKQKYDEWFQAYGEDYAGGNLIFGMEVFIDDIFLENLENMPRVPTFENSHYMLVTFDSNWSYEQIKEALIRLKGFGIVPILAHVETYPDLTNNAYKVKLLSDEGVLIQLTASCFMNKSYQKFIRSIMMLNAIDLVASNGHDSSDRPPILGESYEFVSRNYSKAWANRLFLETPLKVFYGEHYFRPLNAVKLRKSFRIGMGVSVAFGLLIMAIGISQMNSPLPNTNVVSEIELTEESIPAGISNIATYESIIASNHEQLLKLQNKFATEMSDIHDLIIKAEKEIPELDERISKIDAYMHEAGDIEKDYDTQVYGILKEVKDELIRNGYSTRALDDFKENYVQFKESIKNKYLVIF